MKYRVLNLADLQHCPDALDVLRPIAEIETRQPTREALLAGIEKADAYFASLHVRADAEVLERARRLRVIATSTTGLDHIDLDVAAQKGIQILSLKEETAFLDSVTATAEMTWALLLATIRRLPWAFDAAKRGEWARDRFRGQQIAGMTMGILGYGRLGRIVGEYAKAFRLRVLACDVRAVDPAPGVELVDLPTLLRESDILSVHIHLTPENRGLLSRREFAAMKPGAILVNTSRGAILDQGAFLEALANGPLAGAGIDVIEGEWQDDLAEHPLIRYANTHENLVISPHIGGVTHQSQRMTLEFTARKLAAFLQQMG